MEGRLIRARYVFKVVRFEGDDLVHITSPIGTTFYIPVELAEEQTKELMDVLAEYREGRGKVVPFGDR